VVCSTGVCGLRTDIVSNDSCRLCKGSIIGSGSVLLGWFLCRPGFGQSSGLGPAGWAGWHWAKEGGDRIVP